MKKKVVALAALVLLMGLLAFTTSCGNNDDDVVDIMVMFGKMEVTTEFEQMLAVFNEENTGGFRVTLLPTADGQGVAERARIQYAAGDPVTLMHLDAGFVAEFENYIRDLSDQPWVQVAMDGVLDFVTRPGGRIMGLPASVEGFGIVYNRDVVSGALGNFNTQGIRTLNDFVSFIDQLEAAGVDAIITTPSLDWSLGFHLMNKFLATQAEDLAVNMAFLNSLLGGTADLYNNVRFQNWMDMLDVMLERNSHAHAPMDPLFDDGVINLADGAVAMWFQGNWIAPPMAGVNPDGNFGFIPVPMSNDANDFANRRISIDVPQFWVVDQHLSTPEQQEAALYFLNWMATSPAGQYHSAMHLGLAPVMYGARYVPQDTLSIAMVDYLERGEALPWVISYFSSGLLTVTGGGVQQYALGLIDARQLATIIEDAFEALP
jgi:raffinose/stachyose/melibiose transport system substrate-binding protein